MTKHILVHYDTALQQAESTMAELSQATLLMLNQIMVAEQMPDPQQLNQIIAQIGTAQDLANQLQSTCTRLLSTFHPMGKDLRLVLALSRSADKLLEATQEINTIARLIKKAHKKSILIIFAPISALMRMAIDQLQDASASVITKDRALALTIRARDKELDAQYRATLADIVQTAQETRSHLSVYTLFIIRAIERVGDIAKTIAALCVFLTDAEDIRHER